MYTILVADYNKKFNQVLSKKVNSEENCQVVAEVYDGKSAIMAIVNKRPDIIIIDFILPEADGLYVVEYIRRYMDNYHPIIYVLSCIGNEIIIDKLNALDIDFFNLKPISFDVILHNLRVITHSNYDQRNEPLVLSPKKSLKTKIKDLVIQFGVLPHRLSTKCIIDALVYYIENSDHVQTLSKSLYPAIAQNYNITSYAVEKNIRSAIEIMRKARTPLFISFFPSAEYKRVTNGEFIATLGDVNVFLDERLSEKMPPQYLPPNFFPNSLKV